MQLVFPTYKMNRAFPTPIFRLAGLDDFEYIKKSPSKFDMTIGAVMNQFIGKPANHLKLGSGINMDLTYTDKRSYTYGLNTSIYINKLKQDYPLQTQREQFETPNTVSLGFIFGKWFPKFNIQSEIAYVAQNVTERIDANDDEWVQLRGWSPGIAINYPIKFGKDRPYVNYGIPTVINNFMNLHFGVKYLDLSLKEASGLMLEVGLSYRMTVFKIKDYKLKDTFIEN